jgi:hypothetical protein
VRVRFGGCHVPTDLIARASPTARRRNLFSKRARPVAAIHYQNRSHSVQSRHELGAEGGNGELQIEGARRGAVARQEARANSASRPSCRRIDNQGVAPGLCRHRHHRCGLIKQQRKGRRLFEFGLKARK